MSRCSNLPATRLVDVKIVRVGIKMLTRIMLISRKHGLLTRSNELRFIAWRNKRAIMHGRF